MKDGTEPFTGEQEIEEWFVCQVPYEKILIAGKRYVSTDAVHLLTERNIDVIFLDSCGDLITSMTNIMVSGTATKYTIGQYDTFHNPDNVLYLQKNSLEAELQSQSSFITKDGTADLH